MERGIECNVQQSLIEDLGKRKQIKILKDRIGWISLLHPYIFHKYKTKLKVQLNKKSANVLAVHIIVNL